MKKKILIIVGIIVAIFAIVKIWECTIGFKFKNQSEFRKFTSKVENMSDVTGYIRNPKTFEEIEMDNEDTQKILELLNETKVKHVFYSMIGSGYTFIFRNNDSEIRVLVMVSQISVNGKDYDILDNEDYTLFNQIKTIGEKYRKWEY